MANTPATGAGPFEFTDANGRQVSIPLTAFTFDASGKLVVNPGWSAVTSVQPASSLLAYAIAQRFIAAAVLPSPVPAMIVKASDPGSAGNNISVAISAVSPNPDPTQTSFTVTVSETDNYTNLSAAIIESVLGSDTTAGSSPGLVKVLHSPLNTGGTPTTGSFPLKVLPSPPPPLPASTARVEIDDAGSNPVFVLFAKKDGNDGALTNVNISAGGSATAFNLQAIWTKAVAGVTLANLATTIQALSYEITVAPPGGGAFAVPAASTTSLSRGSPGNNALATLFAS